MFKTDVSTAVASLPTPAAAGTPGYFTGGNPGSGIPATVVDADFLNMMMMELANICTAGGQTLSKTTYNQALLAIEELIEVRAGNYALDTGVANAYIIALDPLLTSYTTNFSGRFKVVNANTGASTLDAGGGAIALVNETGGALLAGDLPAGAVVSYSYVLADNKAYITSLVPSQALSQTAADARYAKLAGLLTQVFEVADGVAGNDAVNFEQAAGLGQNYNVVTGSRAVNTLYYNTGKKLLIAIIGLSTNTVSVNSASATVNGVSGTAGVFGNNSGTTGGIAVIFVMPGYSYKLNSLPSSGSVQSWVEIS
jgi:hypothetical protein